MYRKELQTAPARDQLPPMRLCATCMCLHVPMLSNCL